MIRNDYFMMTYCMIWIIRTTHLTTRKVLFFSNASASLRAVRSVRPTLVRLNVSRCVFAGSAANSCANFSSEIFCKHIIHVKLLYNSQMLHINPLRTDSCKKTHTVICQFCSACKFSSSSCKYITRGLYFWESCSFFF